MRTAYKQQGKSKKVKGKSESQLARRFHSMLMPNNFGASAYNHSQFRNRNGPLGPDRISPFYQIMVAINDDTLCANSGQESSSAVEVLTAEVMP